MNNSLVPFFYKGRIPASKSLFNRWAIVRSFNSDLRLTGDSECEDVRLMKRALENLQAGARDFDCGSAGTVLRFLALRVSRFRGEFTLRGSERLMARPQAGLLGLLGSLGVKADLDQEKSELRISSQGWREPPGALVVDQKESSQFLSALLLSSWKLPFDLKVQVDPEGVSESYLQMTLSILKKAGLRFENKENLLTVFKNQNPRPQNFVVESDLSSAFALASLAAVAGEAQLEDFPWDSAQGDLCFVGLLHKMGVAMNKEGNTLEVRRAEALKPLSMNLNSTPDLLPCLSVLCAAAEGTSELSGVAHLKGKESDRIAKALELCEKVGRKAYYASDTLHIEGKTFDEGEISRLAPVEWDPAQDHRWVMAAGILQWMGFKVNLRDAEVVKKSFPEFLGLLP